MASNMVRTARRLSSPVGRGSVFALAMPAEQARFLREPGAADQVLGISGLDADQIDIFRIEDLEDLGRAGYLADGLGIPPDQIADARATLDAATGWVMVLRSRAFGGRALTLTPADSLRLIATFHEPGTDWSSTPMTTDSAKPYTAPRPSPRQARNEARRIGALLFAVVMGLIALVLALVIT